MDDALSDMINSIINSEPDLLVDVNSELSPINKENKKVSPRDNNVGNDPLNPGNSDKNRETTSALDSSLISKNEELLTPDNITDASSQPTININLAQVPNIEKEKSENAALPVLNTTSSYNNLNTTVNNIDNSTTSNISNIVTPSPLNAESTREINSTRESSNEKNSNISNVGTNTIIDKSPVNIPNIIENILNGTDNYSQSNETIQNNQVLKSFDTAYRDVINTRENNNIVSNSDNINSSSSINRLEKTTDQKYSSESSMRSDSSNNMIIDKTKINLTKPSTNISNNSSNSSTSENNSASTNSSNSTGLTATSVSDTNINNQTSTYNSNNQNQTTQSAAQEPVNNIVNIDINQLVQSIRRLETILIGGIDVTLKDA